MVATLAFLALTTVAPSNLYVFFDVSLKYSPVLMTSFSKLLNVVWTGNPLLDLLGWETFAAVFDGSMDSNRKANAKAEKEGSAA